VALVQQLWFPVLMAVCLAPFSDRRTAEQLHQNWTKYHWEQTESFNALFDTSSLRHLCTHPCESGLSRSKQPWGSKCLTFWLDTNLNPSWLPRLNTVLGACLMGAAQFDAGRSELV